MPLPKSLNSFPGKRILHDSISGIWENIAWKYAPINHPQNVLVHHWWSGYDVLYYRKGQGIDPLSQPISL